LNQTKDEKIDFNKIKDRFYSKTYQKSIFWFFRDIILILILAIPGYFLNSSFWENNWALIYLILMNRVGRLYFGPKMFSLFSRLLPLTDKDKMKEHEAHAIKILKFIFPSLNPMINKNGFKNMTPKDRLNKILTFFTPIIFFIILVIFGLALYINSEPWIFTSILLMSFLLRIINLFLLIRLLFGNMEILHHITIWTYTSKENTKLTANFLIMENLFLSILIPGLSLDMAPFMLCFVIYAYSSTYPENYYQYLSRAEKNWNRLNTIICIAPYSILLIIKTWYSNLFDSVMKLISFSGHSSRFEFEFLHLIMGLILILLVLISWNRFIRGQFRCSEKFDSQPLLLRRIFGKNVEKGENDKFEENSENWIKTNFGIKMVLYSLLTLSFILSLIDFTQLFYNREQFEFYSQILPAIITSGSLFLFTSLLFRGFFLNLRKVANTSQELTNVMLPYVWKHKLKEIRIHFWGAWHAPMVILFGIGAGIYTCTMFPSPRTLETSIMGVLYNDSLYLTFIWFTIIRFVLGYVIGTVLYIGFFLPHYIWHILALTTIPKDQIAHIKSSPFIKKLKLETRALYAIGFVFLTFMVAFLIITAIMFFSMIIFVGFIYFLNRVISNSYFHRFMAPLEQRTEEEIEIEFLLYPKNK
jgi:hypothetical protein